MIQTQNDPSPAVFTSKQKAVDTGLKVIAKWPDQVQGYNIRLKKFRGEIQGYLVMLTIKGGPTQPLTNGAFEAL